VGETVYELPPEWGDRQKAELFRQLEAARVEARWHGDDLIVATTDDAAAEAIFDRVGTSRGRRTKDVSRQSPVVGVPVTPPPVEQPPVSSLQATESSPSAAVAPTCRKRRAVIEC
jgi:hypothetical protein